MRSLHPTETKNFGCAKLYIEPNLIEIIDYVNIINVIPSCNAISTYL